MARQLRWDGVEPTPGPERFAGQTLAVGDAAEFWTLDYPRRTMVRKEFRLAAVSEHAYWWVEQGLKVDDDALQRSVDGAEAQGVPTGYCGVWSSAGNWRRRKAGPYHQRTDTGRWGLRFGRGPLSGDGAALSPTKFLPSISTLTRCRWAADEYLDVLAHELQHAIHWYADSSEATWLNEGLSELAVTEAGFTPGSMFYYLRRPNVSLVNWPAELGGDVGLNYGAAALFAPLPAGAIRARGRPEGPAGGTAQWHRRRG